MTTTVKLTPMLKQYLEIKESNDDAILFYRMGDFYEMFFDDAELASRILSITLTSRNNKGDVNRVPMCGVPYHAAQGYIAKLVKAGHRVAICEQVEDPAEAKGIVKREVIQTISPGVVTDDQLLDERSNNYVAALERGNGKRENSYGISFLDLSTGKFLVHECIVEGSSYDPILDHFGRLTPAEILVNENDIDDLASFLASLKTLLPGICVTSRDDGFFFAQTCREILQDHFTVINLAGFGCDSMQEGLVAAGVLLGYVQEMQKTAVGHIERITPIDHSSILLIDESSRRNLELTQTLIGSNRDGSLLSVIDSTSTPMGARFLKENILSPLRNAEEINARLDSVNFLFMDNGLRHAIREDLQAIHDIERLNSRMVLGSGNGRDMLALKRSFSKLPQLQQHLEHCETKLFRHIFEHFDPLSEVFDLLERAVHEEAPVTLRDGNLIKRGYNEELDEIVSLLQDGKQHILRLEAEERERTGIPKLKVGYNKVFGYFIEISKIHSDKVPENYIRKQTLVNAERFITPELKKFENRVISAEDRRLDLEYRLFIEIRAHLAKQSPRLLQLSAHIAEIDYYAALAEIAHLYNYRRPIVEDGEELEIVEGRHPVIERSMPSGKFVPNDVFLDQKTDEILIITGPNMAGKSTVLRQTALIVIMAQMGSFVPADSARIGIVDRIFTRVGAMDDLRRGQSTFMVEMNETANILNNATSASLVILDEIGRGTSTFDGLAIAWAVAEHLVQKGGKGVKTLFATHYHELTELARQEERVQNFSIAVKEWRDTIIFLHKLVRGGTNRSYGIQVAALAGVPDAVVARAKEILHRIETGELQGAIPKRALASEGKGRSIKHPIQPSLFQPPKDPLRTYLAKVDSNDVTPRQALEILFELEKLLK